MIVTVLKTVAEWPRVRILLALFKFVIKIFNKKKIINMYLLVVSLPFFGFIFCFIFGRFFGNKISLVLNLFCSFLSVILSFIIFYEICLSQAVITIKLYD